MATEKATGRDSDKIMLRVPDGMRDRIKAAADANNRTMNAEIVARLQASFPDSLISSLPAVTMRAGELPLDVDRLLKSLPADLSSQYALHLYRSEETIARAQLDEAREEYGPLYKKLQKLLANEAGAPGPKARAKEAVTGTKRRIDELEHQLHLLARTISAIHEYRKLSGLPEIRNVREVSVAVRLS